ncbi:Protein kinase domain-containing protein [Psidium guajava]|nr:Protein kinase domain-containing protein [Psidium guajava]
MALNCVFPLESRRAASLVLLLMLCLQSLTVECQNRTSRHLSTQPPSSSKAPEFKTGFRRVILSVVLGVLTGSISALLVACLVKSFILYIHRTPILKGPVVFSPKVSPKTLQTALENESRLLGSSPNGQYHRTSLDNGLVIAVKRLEQVEGDSPGTLSKSAKRRIQKELEVLAGLRHVNLMSLRAYVCEPNGLSLIYDYVPTGSLEDVMKRVRENQLQLKWEARLGIAVGVIKALQYLHFACIPQVLHCDLKPANVLLDAECSPRLADCGLARLVPSLHRTSEYSAPECIRDSRYTDKSDIFSFGMILGVLLTGRDPTDPFFSEAASRGSLGRWLRQLQQAGEAREALDKGLLGEEAEEDEMLMAVRIAVICLSDFPADRPSSDELVPMLTQLHSF